MRADKYSSNSPFVHAIQTIVRSYVGNTTLSYDLYGNSEDADELLCVGVNWSELFPHCVSRIRKFGYVVWYLCVCVLAWGG